MKKFKIGVLALIACLFLTGCGCTNNKLTEFTVTFDSNGGTNVSSVVVTKDETVSEPTNPTKDGYTFNGWYLDGEKYDFSTPVTKDITLKAQWTKVAGGEQEPEKEPEKACKLTCEPGYQLVNPDSKDCSCKKIEVSSISLSKTNITLVVGESTTITATVNPSNAKDKALTWKSSNTKVVTVANGKLTAIGAGDAKITVTAGGKSNTVTVKVITKDQKNLSNALNSMSAKNITKGNTDIKFSYSGCTITNTANTPSNAKTVVENGVVKTVYRDVTAGFVSSTYSVTCGTETGTKTVKHTVAASSYTYAIEENNNTMQDKFIVSGNASGYTAMVGTSNKVYNDTAKAALVYRGTYTKGNTYAIYFNNDANTIFAVKYAG